MKEEPFPGKRHVFMVLIISIIAMTAVQMYLVYRNTILVCGENTVLLYRLLNYENPEQLARMMQDSQNSMTMIDIPRQSSESFKPKIIMPKINMTRN